MMTVRRFIGKVYDDMIAYGSLCDKLGPSPQPLKLGPVIEGRRSGLRSNPVIETGARVLGPILLRR